MTQQSVIEMSVPFELAYCSVVRSYVESSSLAMGLGEDEARSLMSAADELFSYLCREYAPTAKARILCTGGIYFVRIDFVFPFAKLDLHALNLARPVCAGDFARSSEAGLAVVARVVDRFEMDYNRENYIRMSISKNKEYPATADGPAPAQPVTGQYKITAPDTEEIKAISQALRAASGAECCPRSFAVPGKLADMVIAGDYEARIVRGHRGELGGCILWHSMTEKTVECFGPFVFGAAAAEAMAKDLIESCLNAIARTKAQSLICRQTGMVPPPGYFEHLGSYSMKRREGGSFLTSTYYRSIGEDEGAVVWCSPGFDDYLRAEYDRLVFPRQIRIAQNHGETRGARSVISADFDGDQSLITLNPVLSGTDNGANIAAHQDLTRRENILNAFFQVDLGLAWQTEFMPPLRELGFVPRMVLPNAGAGDLVVFTWERD